MAQLKLIGGDRKIPSSFIRRPFLFENILNKVKHYYFSNRIRCMEKKQRILMTHPNFAGTGVEWTFIYMKEYDGPLENYIKNGWTIRYEDV